MTDEQGTTGAKVAGSALIEHVLLPNLLDYVRTHGEQLSPDQRIQIQTIMHALETLHWSMA
jgi:hypothetical protein